MYQAQLVTSAIEFGINKLLSFDDESGLLLQPLIGKECTIQLHELPFPLIFHFYDNDGKKGVSVSSSVAQSTQAEGDQKTEKLTNEQCRISLSLFIVNELKDTSNITRLIREEKLDFDGNLQIAQNLSALFNGINIDIEEILSQHLGDLAAYHAVQTANSFGHFIKHNHKLAMNALSDALLDEKRLAVRPIMVENFIQEVSELRDGVARAEARLQRLEKQILITRSKQN